MKNYFLPTKENNYTPKLLSHKFITIYTFVLLLFNVFTSELRAFDVLAAVDSNTILELHNEERQKHNLGTLTLNSKLTQSAKAKAEVMMATDCWDHYCPNGKSPWEFIDKAGYEYIFAGENLAEGFSNNDKVFEAWMNSKTHRDNILRPEFDEIGIAIVYGNYQGIENNALIVVHFGKSVLGSNPNNTSLPNTPTQAQPTNSSPKEELAISTPKDNEILNTNTPSIQGKASFDEPVTLYINNEPIKNISPEEGLFTYRIPSQMALAEGEHKLKVSQDTPQLVDEIGVSVDTIDPVIEEISFDSLRALDEKQEILLSITTSADTLNLQSNIPAEFVYIRDTSWKMIIDYKEFKAIEILEIEAFDEANNTSKFDLKVNTIKGLADSKVFDFSNPSQSMVFGLDRIGLRRLINTLFVVFVLVLVVIDYYVLTTIGISEKLAKEQFQHHFSIFAILFFVSITGGTTGELLNGIAS